MTRREPLFTGAFLRLWSFAFITFFSAFQLFPAIPQHIIDMGGTTAQAGLFLAIYTYACAFSAPLTGSLADALGRRRVLIFAASSFVLFSVLYGIVPRWPLLLAVACVHGICWSAILSSSAALSSELIPESRRTEGLGYWGMASTAAIAVAPLVGLTVVRHGWIVLCLEIAVLSAVMVVLALRLKEAPRAGAVRLPRAADIVDWRVIVTALTLFVVSFGYGGITSYVALMARARHISPPSLFFTLFAVTILVSRILIAPVGDRWGERMLLFPSLAIVPVALILLAHASSRTALAVSAIAYGIGFGGAYPAFMTYVLGRTSSARRAATFGSVIWAFDTGIGSGSLTIGVLVGRYGYERAFTAAAAFSLLAIPMFIATSRLLPPPSERPTEM